MILLSRRRCYSIVFVPVFWNNGRIDRHEIGKKHYYYYLKFCSSRSSRRQPLLPSDILFTSRSLTNTVRRKRSRTEKKPSDKPTNKLGKWKKKYAVRRDAFFCIMNIQYCIIILLSLSPINPPPRPVASDMKSERIKKHVHRYTVMLCL